ncbi:hypothetical protein [Bailinhaonella thermotolerans]|uniref:Uncharacterized protein n=1 Tax=Bailinhaonella thermotolerans TaxID=1070861 RepID=A0A3A4A498_9ACTN|nr:hypothetical protein [Bailinhaonella thermotolerans]RJL19746.1 hypothetical protein D5H75_40175 [Bailinhaonella thermotolerans]
MTDAHAISDEPRRLVPLDEQPMIQRRAESWIRHLGGHPSEKLLARAHLLVLAELAVPGHLATVSGAVEALTRIRNCSDGPDGLKPYAKPFEDLAAALHEVQRQRDRLIAAISGQDPA